MHSSRPMLQPSGLPRKTRKTGHRQSQTMQL